jgi:hypothetical protein
MRIKDLDKPDLAMIDDLVLDLKKLSLMPQKLLLASKMIKRIF